MSKRQKTTHSPTTSAIQEKFIKLQEVLKKFNEKNPKKTLEETLKKVQEETLKKVQEIFEKLGHRIKKSDLIDLFSKDSVPSFDGRILVVGAYDAGKTTLVMNLIDEEIPLEKQSTDGIDVYFGKLLFDIVSKKLLKRKAGEHNYPKSVYQKVLAYLLQANTSDINASSKGRDEKNKPDELLQPNPTKETIITRFHKIIESFKLKTNPDIQKFIPIAILDFAGQIIYYATHQTFITSHGIYIVTFDGSRDIKSGIAEQYNLADGMMSILGNIRHWVSSILAYSTDENNGFPKIIFVATHKDRIEANEVEEKRTTMMRTIQDCFQGQSITQHLVQEKLFFVNGLDKEDPEIDELRNYLSDTISRNPLWGSSVPKQFLVLEMMLASLMEDGKYILARTDIEELNRNTGFEPLSIEELEVFLQLQNMHGKLTYLNSHLLRGYVVINPTCLIDVLKSIVTAAPTTKELMEGRLSKNKLRELWNSDRFAKIKAYQDYFRDLLIHFDVLSEAKRYDNTTGNKVDVDFYFVPCMISARNSTSYNRKCLTQETCIGFVFAFQGSDVPTALPNRLIASILSIWNVKSYESKDLMFANFTVVVLDRKHDLAIQIEQNNMIAVYVVHRKQKALITRDLASSVRECIENNLTRISEVYSVSFMDEFKQHRYYPFKLMLKPGCLSSTCLVNPVDVVQHGPTHVCPNHRHETAASELSIWYTDRTLKECPKGCPGISEPLLPMLPNDTQLLRLCDCLSPEDTISLALELGTKHKKLDEIKREQTMTTMMQFYSLRLCREKNKTCGDFVKCMGRTGIDVHNMCKILRQEEVQCDLPDNILICKPSDEMLDKLCIRIGKEWMILGLELGIEIEKLEQLEYQHPGDLREISRSMLYLWRRREETGTIRELVEALGRTGRNPVLVRDILENCSSFPKLNPQD